LVAREFKIAHYSIVPQKQIAICNIQNIIIYPSIGGRMRTAIHCVFNRICLTIIVLTLTCSNSYSSQFKPLQLEELFSKSLEELMDLKIISASKRPSKVSEIPASAIVVTRDEIAKYGYSSLEEILEGVPGFYQVDDLQGEGTNFGIRGFWNNTWNRNVAIMVNGVRQRDDFNSSNSFATINVPVDAIDKIEIVRGPMAVIYGNGAFFGVVNIITNETSDSNQKQKVSSSIFSNGSYGLFARSEGVENDFKYSFNSSYRKNGGLDVPYSKMGGTGNHNTNGDFEDIQKYISFSGKFKQFHTEFSYNETISAKPFLTQPSVDYDGTAIHNATRISFDYTKEISNSVSMVTKVFYNHFEIEYDYDTDSENRPNLWEVQDVRSSSLTIESNIFFTPTPKFSATLGLEYHSAFQVSTTYDLPLFDLSNIREDIGDDKIVSRALLTQVNYHASDMLLLIGGIRLEQLLAYNMFSSIDNGLGHIVPDTLFNYRAASRQYDQEDIVVIPNFAAIYSFNQRNVLKLLYGEAVNHPSFIINHDLVFIPLVPDVKPEKVSTIELNYLSIFNEFTTINLSLFHSKFSNLITRFTGFYDNGEYYSTWNNSGDMSANGAEFQIKLNPINNLKTDISLTLQNVNDENHSDREVAFSPEVLGYIKLLYSIWPDLTFGLTANYVSEMESQWDSTPSSSTSSEIGRIGKKVDGYTILSSNIRAQNILIDRSFINLRITNIYDSDIFYAATTNQPWAKYGTLGAGRAIHLTVGLEF
jgi:outer membrane receptor for ferrienterochelin and colicin